MNILHIDCSPRIPSYSRRLSAAVLDRIVAAHPQACVVRRDLGLNPLPHADTDYAETLGSPAALAACAGSKAVELSEHLIQELEASDVLLIGTPMHNFTVPSTLKSWIDQILRMGRSLTTTSAGEKTGLLANRPVYLAIASGGMFSGERAKQPDFLTSYLTAALGCIGLKNLQFLSLQGTAFLDAEQLAGQQEAQLSSLLLPE